MHIITVASLQAAGVMGCPRARHPFTYYESVFMAKYAVKNTYSFDENIYKVTN